MYVFERVVGSAPPSIPPLLSQSKLLVRDKGAPRNFSLSIRLILTIFDHVFSQAATAAHYTMRIRDTDIENETVILSPIMIKVCLWLSD